MSEQPDQGPDVDIDQVLAAIDPEFDKSMTELGGIQNADVDLAATDLDVDHDHDEDGDDEAPDLTAAAPEGAGLMRRLAFRFGNTLSFALFSLRRAVEFAKYAVHAFGHASRAQKAMAVGLFALFGLGLVVFLANLRGQWLPGLNAPVIGRFEPIADSVEDVADDEPRVRLDLAFPPEVHEFLFKPFKVNMRATAENPHPMGAFEFVVAVDTAEIATEARDREVELSDMVQRVFEDQTFAELETEAGKERLKAQLKEQLEAKLGPKRVLAVNFKTFVLKP